MANQNSGGFRLWGTMSGGQGASPAAFVSELANNYGTAINKGDPIIPVSDGTVAIAAVNSTNLLGVVTGCNYVINGKPTPSDFVPASTTFSPTTVGSPNASRVQWIPFTADTIWEIDGATAAQTTLAANLGLIGNNAPFTFNSLTASTVLGVSVACLDLASAVTTAQQFRIISIPGYTLEGLQLVDQDFTSARFRFLVVCNQGFLPSYTTTGI